MPASPKEAGAGLRRLETDLARLTAAVAVQAIATSVAHELNQPLTAIANYMQALEDLLDDPRPDRRATARAALEDCARETMRAGAILRGLKDATARAEPVRRPEPLRTIVDDSLGLACAGTRVARRIEIGPDCGLVLADGLQIRLVIYHLAANAVAAMASVADPRLAVVARLDDDGWVRVAVEDNGPGFAPGRGESLFVAPIGTGDRAIGRGISVCQSIIEGHGGRIWAERSALGGAAVLFSLEAA